MFYLFLFLFQNIDPRDNNPIESYIQWDTLIVRYWDKKKFYSLVDNKIVKESKFEVNHDFNPILFRTHNNLLIHIEGGIVLSNDSGDRIDKSYNHKLQVGSSLFVNNDTIFRFGGYGFFSHRNFITFFDQNISEWESRDYCGENHPTGISLGVTYKNDNDIYFVGGYTVNPNRRSLPLESKLIQKFSFKTNQWSVVGHVKDFYVDQNENTIQTDSGFIYFGNYKIFSVDVLENRVEVFSQNPISRKVQSSLVSPVKYKDSIYFTHDYNFEVLDRVHYSELLENKIDQYRFYDNESKFQKLFESWWSSLILPISIILVFISLNIFFKRKILVFNKSLYNTRLIKLNLSEDESLLLELFMKDQNFTAENSKILKLFDNRDLDSATIARRKNEVLNQLDIKLQTFSNRSKTLISYKKSGEDRRNRVYKLDRSVFIIL